MVRFVFCLFLSNPAICRALLCSRTWSLSLLTGCLPSADNSSPSVVWNYFLHHFCEWFKPSWSALTGWSGRALRFFPCGSSVAFNVRSRVAILELLEQNNFPLPPTKFYWQVPCFTNTLASKPVCKTPSENTHLREKSQGNSFQFFCWIVH